MQLLKGSVNSGSSGSTPCARGAIEKSTSVIAHTHTHTGKREETQDLQEFNQWVRNRAPRLMLDSLY